MTATNMSSNFGGKWNSPAQKHHRLPYVHVNTSVKLIEHALIIACLTPY